MIENILKLFYKSYHLKFSWNYRQLLNNNNFKKKFNSGPVNKLGTNQNNGNQAALTLTSTWEVDAT